MSSRVPRRAVDERRHRRAILFRNNTNEVPRVVDEVAPVGVGGAPDPLLAYTIVDGPTAPRARARLMICVQ